MNFPLLSVHPPSARTLALVFAPALLLLAVTALTSTVAGLPLALFSRDPMATMDGHPLTGVQSTLGVLVWCGSAAVCLFSAATVHRTVAGRPLAWFLGCSAAVTLLLALDDLFLVHDDLAERYLRIGEKPVLLIYAALVGWYLARFREVILGSSWTLLAVAFFFFGGSVGVDLLQGRWLSPWRIFFEDGFKLLGIVSWSGYLIHTCFQSVDASALSPIRVTREERP